MKVLLLGGENKESHGLEVYLANEQEKLLFITEKITVDVLGQFQPEIIVSYNYKFILRPEIFNFPRFGTINLHISCLPWNRGADPNFWSHIEDTPKGVSVHYIDEGIDTGDIIAQDIIKFGEEDTLRTSYHKLHTKIQKLFKNHWHNIKFGRSPRSKQQGEGTHHSKKDRDKFEYLLKDKGWNIPISLLKELKLDHKLIHGT